MLITKSLNGTPPNSQSKIRRHIIFIFIACFLYSFICILINSLSELGISPAYSHCMGDENFAANKKILIGLVLLPAIVLMLTTLRIECKTFKLVRSFKKGPNYQKLMKEKNFSLLIIIGEETSFRSTVVNIGVLIFYIITFLIFSLSTESQPTQLERLLMPPAVTWLVKEPLILFWASYVSKTNLTSIQEGSKSINNSQGAGAEGAVADCESINNQLTEQKGRYIIRTDRYLDLLAKNPFLEPVPFASPKSPILEEVDKIEMGRIEARKRFDLSVKRFEDSKKYVIKNGGL